MEETSMIIAMMIFFIIANLALGFWSARRTKNSEDYMLGDRKMGTGVLIFTTFATSLGAGDMLGYPALGYIQGWSSLHFILAMPVVIIIMALTVGKRYYDLKVTTISDLVCRIYGENKYLRIIPSICISLGMLSWLAAQYSAFGKTLNLLTGADPLIGLLIGAALFISYTVVGGLVSVIYTDVLQGVFLAIGVIAVFIAVTMHGGGFVEVQQGLPADYSTFIGPVGTITILMFWLNKGLSRFTNFPYWQRIGSAKDSKTGIRGIILGMVVTGILGVALALTGMAAYKINPGGMSDPEMIFAEYSVSLFPKWLAGFFLGALWAAILSSAAGFLNSSTTLLGHDLWFKVIKKGQRSEGALLKDLRIITLVIGVGTLLIAWLVPSVLSLFIWAGVWLTPPLIPVLCAAIFDKKGDKIPKNYLILSMILSGIVGVVFEMVPSLKALLSGGTIPAFVTSLVIILIGAIVGYFNKNHRNNMNTPRVL
ncbi:sodium:solute symporter family protein [Robertmurraya yapensis]|uniref:Sodium:solute symporter family protein n=2 Tax=Bacillaceae TaxID=186817 RepID=A0A3S0I7E5_9BACI|nr:sodium:solute symporter family protein [Bacillus yapensis]TKS94771.1 sodium:solute symporter family protein [Bacillus yapensis]